MTLKIFLNSHILLLVNFYSNNGLQAWFVPSKTTCHVILFEVNVINMSSGGDCVHVDTVKHGCAI